MNAADRKTGPGGWTPVGLSIDLPKGGVLRTFVDGRDVVIWRSRSGAVRAWDNRCPHRGMRLSHGFVRGESLTCIYHGWRYGTDGVCSYIPAHPDLKPPSSLCVTPFAAVETGGLVWASLAEMEDAPALGDLDADPVRSMIFECDKDDVRSILASARFPIAQAWRPDEGRFSSAEGAAGSVVLDGKSKQDRRRLIAALQSLPDDRTALHLLTSPLASSSLKVELSRWLERVRWFAENPAVETQSWNPLAGAGEA